MRREELKLELELERADELDIEEFIRFLWQEAKELEEFRLKYLEGF